MRSSIFRNPKTRKNVLYSLTFLILLRLIYTETALLHYGEALTIQQISPGFESVLPLPTLTSSVVEPKILLVSALFPLAKSKHTHGEYEYWLSNFLKSITTPIYFYAPPSLASTVLSLRGSLPIYVNTTFTSPFDVPPLQGLETAYEHLHTIDREAFRHNPELYAVWNAKPWLLDNAVKQLRREKGEVYEYAFWNDAGSFRGEHAYTKWPDPKRVDQVWKAGVDRVAEAGLRVDEAKIKEELLFFPFTGTFNWLRRYWQEDDGPIDAEISEGSFFGGSPKTISWWSKVFYTYHDHYLHKGYFVGKDQTLINSLFLLFPSRIFGVWLNDPAARVGIPHFDSGPLGMCGNSWFYYQFFLASDEDRGMMREKWMKELEGRVEWPWKGWEWWMRRQECRLTRVLWMRSALWDVFGKGWGVKKSVVVEKV